MATVSSAIFTAVNFVYAALFGGPIDGSAWDVKVKQDGFFHWGSKRETLVFHNGKLVVAGAVSLGYPPHSLSGARGRKRHGVRRHPQ